MQSEVIQEEKNKYGLLMHIHGIEKNATDEPSRECLGDTVGKVRAG